jgi:chitodextrinase
VPSALATSGITQSSLVLSWAASSDAASGVKHYNLFKNGSFVISVTGLSHAFSGLAANTDFNLQISAVDNAGNESARAQITGRTATVPDTQAPNAPSSIVLGAVTSSSINVSWPAATDNGSSGLSHYEVWLEGDKQGNETSLARSFSGLNANSDYRVEIYSVDNAGNKSAAAAELSVRTATQGSEPAWQEIVIEPEVGANPGAWRSENTIPGYSGTGYLVWRGQNEYTSAPGSPKSFNFQVTQAGTYKLFVIARRELGTRDAESIADIENDVWARVSGVGISGYEKLYMNHPNIWNGWYQGGRVHRDAVQVPEYTFPSAGTYTLQLDGRSKDYFIDKIVFTNDRQGPPAASNFRITGSSAPGTYTLAWDAVTDFTGQAPAYYQIFLDLNNAARTPYVHTSAWGTTTTISGVDVSWARKLSIRAVDLRDNRGAVSAQLDIPLGGVIDGGGGSDPDPLPVYTSTSSFQNIAISPAKTSNFSVSFEMTPSASPIDGLLGLAKANAGAYSDLAAIVRFAPSGKIDAYNGSAYAALNSFAYQAGISYRFTMDVDVSNKKYSVKVRAASQSSDTIIASNYAYRSSQANTTLFANMALIATVGGNIKLEKIVFDGAGGGEVPQACPGLAHGASRSLNDYFTRATVPSGQSCAPYAVDAIESCNDGELSLTPSNAVASCRVLGSGGGSAGTFIQHQLVELDFEGPASSETASSPNPFLDFRMNVTFAHASGATHVVPGFYDGDGNGGSSGNVWRVRFNPELEGRWDYEVSFRQGSKIAASLDESAGSAVHFDGEAGHFDVNEKDASAPGYLKHGRLEYVNGHYLKFRDGPYYVKTGTDDPEDLLGYIGFDGSLASSEVHSYSSHAADWVAGDPDWNGGKGKALIGALNYLSSRGVNSIYFLPMNIGGDAQNTHPFVGNPTRGGSASNDNVHYDISKLTQWEMVFDHAQRKGIMLHFVLAEAEEGNKQELNIGPICTQSGEESGFCSERKLFFRELIARFGHHAAIQWNLSEEYEYKYAWSSTLVKKFAQRIRDLDPFDRPLTVHNQANPDTTWAPFVGDSRFTLTSFQYSGGDAGKGDEVEEWRHRTMAAGHPIPIMMDELKPIQSGNQALMRREVLWPTLLSGGGIEFYMSGIGASMNNFRDFDNIWKWGGYARKFMQDQLPFWEMESYTLSGDTRSSMDNLASNASAQVFAKAGEVYAVYLPSASSPGTLDLRGVSGAFRQLWFNPRSGQLEGACRNLNAGSQVSLGTAPSGASEDWALVVKRGSCP